MIKLSFRPCHVSSGTSLQGYLKVPYSRIVNLLGFPNSRGDDYKVSTEWNIIIDGPGAPPGGAVATIYDWKATSLYENGLPRPQTLRELDYDDWHVGGFNKHAAELVARLFEESQP